MGSLPYHMWADSKAHYLFVKHYASNQFGLILESREFKMKFEMKIKK